MMEPQEAALGYNARRVTGRRAAGRPAPRPGDLGHPSRADPSYGQRSILPGNRPVTYEGNEVMRKPVQIALIVGLVILAIVAAVLFARYQKTAADLATSRAAEDQAASRYVQTIDAIAEIQDSLNAIAVGDTGVGVKPWKIGTGQEPAQPKGQEALDRIAVLRSSIERNKVRIRELEAGLKKSGIKVTGLEKMIFSLKQTVTEKEQMVAVLSAQVDTLKTQVAGLETTVQETRDTLAVRNVTLEEKRRELATVFYAVGTKGELEKAGVVKEKGGVLGIGQTLVPVPGAPETAFTPLDTDAEKMIWTGAAKARVISAQPSTSYELRLVDGKMELHILDTGEFRRIKRVIIVKS